MFKQLQIDLCQSYDLSETFLPKVVRLLLSMGVEPGVENDDFLLVMSRLHPLMLLTTNSP